MNNNPRFYKSNKRGKEVARQKKQEEKRLQRQGKPEPDQEAPEASSKVPASDDTEAEGK